MDFNRELDKLEALASKRRIPPRICASLLNQIKYLRENVDAQLIDHPIAARNLPKRRIPKSSNDTVRSTATGDLIDLHKELPNV